MYFLMCLQVLSRDDTIPTRVTEYIGVIYMVYESVDYIVLYLHSIIRQPSFWHLLLHIHLPLNTQSRDYRKIITDLTNNTSFVIFHVPIKIFSSYSMINALDLCTTITSFLKWRHQIHLSLTQHIISFAHELRQIESSEHSLENCSLEQTRSRYIWLNQNIVINEH